MLGTSNALDTIIIINYTIAVLFIIILFFWKKNTKIRNNSKDKTMNNEQGTEIYYL